MKRLRVWGSRTSLFTHSGVAPIAVTATHTDRQVIECSDNRLKQVTNSRTEE